MKNLTPTQKRMEREFADLNFRIEKARKGQQYIRPTANGYTQQQQEQYASYQGFVDRAEARINELKAEAKR